MRLTPQQQTSIRTAVAETSGEDANIWLFGSKVYGFDIVFAEDQSRAIEQQAILHGIRL